MTDAAGVIRGCNDARLLIAQRGAGSQIFNVGPLDTLTGHCWTRWMELEIPQANRIGHVLEQRATSNVLETSDVTIEKMPSYIYIYVRIFIYFYIVRLINISRKVWINCRKKIISLIN